MLESWRGIVVDRRLGGLVPASVRVEQSLIERVADVGILASDLARPVNEDTVTLDPGVNLDVVDTVVRDVGSDAGQGSSCPGNGIRVRSTGKVERPDSVMLTVENSLVERTREAGIHVQGAMARISSTIVREVRVDSCSGRFGDAIAAYAQPEMPTEVSIEGSLLEGAERASVALFDATANVRGVVASCNGAPVVTSRSFGESAATVAMSWCGCGEARRACERVDDELEAALHGRLGCDPDDDRVCFRGVADNFFNVIQGSENPLLGVTFWTLDDLSVAPAVSDKLGSFELGGLPPRADLVLSVTAEDYMPIVMPMRTGSDDSVPLRAPMPPAFAADAVALLYSVELDFRTAILVTEFVCHAPEAPADGETFVPCIGRGFRGVTMDLSPRAAGGPIYISPGGFPELQLTSITDNSGAAFVNAAAGDATLSLSAPSGENGFACSLDAFGDGWFADEVAPPFSLREHFIAGANNVRFFFCRAGN